MRQIFSTADIQSVLDTFVRKYEDGFFIYQIHAEKNVYIQGQMSRHREGYVYCEAVSRAYTPALTPDGEARLLELGWAPAEDGWNHGYECPLERLSNGELANFLFESLRLYALDPSEITVSVKFAEA